MISHIVLFKLKDYSAREKAEITAELKGILESLQNKIYEVKYLEVGVNHEHDSNNFDFALTAHFESLRDLDTYLHHPEHLKASERIKETTVKRAAVDYFFDA